MFCLLTLSRCHLTLFCIPGCHSRCCTWVTCSIEGKQLFHHHMTGSSWLGVHEDTGTAIGLPVGQQTRQRDRMCMSIWTSPHIHNAHACRHAHNPYNMEPDQDYAHDIFAINNQSMKTNTVFIKNMIIIIVYGMDYNSHYRTLEEEPSLLTVRTRYLCWLFHYNIMRLCPLCVSDIHLNLVYPGSQGPAMVRNFEITLNHIHSDGERA